jgi:hypothetical protein
LGGPVGGIAFTPLNPNPMTPREKEIVADARLKSPEFITKVVRNCVPKSGPSMAGASCVSAVERIFVAQETPPCVLLSAAYAVSAPPAVGRVGPELVSLSPSPGVTSASAGPAADRPDAELGPLCVEAQTGGSDSPLRSSTPTARPKPMADRAADGPPGGMAAATSAEPQHAPIMVSPSAAGMGGGPASTFSPSPVSSSVVKPVAEMVSSSPLPSSASVEVPFSQDVGCYTPPTSPVRRAPRRHHRMLLHVRLRRGVALGTRWRRTAVSPLMRIP